MSPAPQAVEAPVPAAVPETKPDLLACVMDATLSREMNELQYTRAVSEYMASSGYFGDAMKVSQSAVKIMLGRDLGVSATVAMMSIHIGKSGRPSLSGALIAALLKRAGYSWKFVAHTPTECTATFYYGDKPMTDEAGKRTTVTWTYEDAKKALLTGLVGDGKAPSMYDKYGADMLFNRMIVRFQRRFAPEVTAGMVIYTPDELEEIEERHLDAEIERKNAPGVAEVKAAEAVAERKIAELKAQVEPATVTLAELIEAPVPAMAPSNPQAANAEPRQIRDPRTLSMPKRGA
jgi:hypothetical protein